VFHTAKYGTARRGALVSMPFLLWSGTAMVGAWLPDLWC